MRPSRQWAHEQARLLATMVELGLCDLDATGDEVSRLAEPPVYAADEIRAALSWTRRAADRELDFAETLVLALDPEWAARRYASAAQERNVIGYLDPDSTATVTGTGLPVEQAAAACARVEELARAANRAGHPGRIGPLRTDI